MDIKEKILKLKKQKNAIILAHTYTYPEVQDIADFVGDSYGLSKKASEVKNVGIIVFAGVRFMAETAAILAPRKKVLLPVEFAGCPMADMITADELQGMKEQYPDAAVVCYVNSNVETKALSSVCVTSSNAVKIVDKLEEEQIIFVPDRHLGSYTAEQLPDKDIILWEGHCPVHDQVKPENVIEAKAENPEAIVIMHPECHADTRAEADFILSTGQMIELVKKKEHKEYIVVTEQGIIHALKKCDSDAKFLPLINAPLICTNMKYMTLEGILQALENEETVISVPEDIAKKAGKALENMLRLAE